MPRRRAFPIAAALAALSCAASARAAAFTLPAGVEARSSVEGIDEYALPNGLRVLLFPDPSKDTATVNITYLVGSKHENYGETGMAHLLEHLVFKGTPKHPDIPQELTAHGARPNGTTWFDRTNYFETFAATEENLAWALDLEADRMVNSFISRKDLDSEMTVVRNEFEIGENQPQSVLLDRILSTAFLWHNYGNTTIGARADIENVPIERLQAFYRAWYQPDNAVLIVAGKIDPARTLALIADRFGRIPRPERKLPVTWTAEPAQDGARSVELRRVGESQMVGAAYHVPAGSHPDFAALELLAFVLGDTPSGRLHRTLVEPGLAASVSAQAWALRDPGVFFVSADLRAATAIGPARDALLAVVEGAAKNPPGKAEVDRARNDWLNNWEQTMRNSQRAALELSEWAAMGDWRLVFLQRDRIEAVKPEDLARVAAAYLREANRTLGVYVPAKEAERAPVPAAPDLQATLKDYRGRAVMAEGEAFDPTPANIESRVKRVTLPGGLKLALLPRETRGDAVSVALNLHFGDERALAGRRAAAAVAGSLLLRGTARRDRQQIQDEIDRLRARLSVTGSVAEASARADATRATLEDTLRLMVELLREPSFPAGEMETLRQEQLVAAEEAKHDPGTQAFVTLQRHLDPWPADDPRYTPSSDERIAEWKAASVETARAFHRDFYGASNGEMAIVGDFDPAKAEALVRELLGAWKSPRPFTRIPSVVRELPAIDRTIETPDKESAVMAAAQVIAMRDDDPDYPALTLGSFITGGGFLNSRLATRIRRKDGLSYGVGARFTASSFDRAARFGAQAIYAPQNSAKLEAAFREEIARVIAEGFTPAEVAEAKSGWLQSRKVSRAQDRDLALQLAAADFANRTIAWDGELEKQVGDLTPARIHEAVKRRLALDRISIVQAGDFARASAAAGASAPAASSGGAAK